MSLRNQVNLLVGLGYKRLAAQAKVAHDVVLLAMHKSGFKAKSTIKGGVVMSSITRDIWRATMDMDIDFVHHSISKRSIELFVRRLDRAMEGVDIAIAGPIIDLKHEDYRGKRIFITAADSTTPRPLRTKIDIGVHMHDEMAQKEYSFDVVFSKERADLQVNSNEQIFVEKLLSLLRHGIVSHRPKDVFDMYYLLKECDLDRGVVANCLDLLTFENKRGIASLEEVRESVETALVDAAFRRRLSKARERWIDVGIDVIADEIVAFLYDL